jgi:hypothetical protein
MGASKLRIVQTMNQRFIRRATRTWTLAALGTVPALLSQPPDSAPISYNQVPALIETSGAAVPVGLQQMPLSPADRIVVRDTHFYTVGADLQPNTADDKRIRFFGVSLALSANFPSEADGEALARRLANLGVNIVRLHAIDQPARQGDVYPAGILVETSQPNLDVGATKALKRFISQLRQHGIYVDLNLHVNHTFPAEQGDFVPPQSKPLQIFDADMVRWQKQYAQNLLSALDLRNAPNLALVEVDNESTLIDNWQEGRLPTLVTGRYRDELALEWAKYEQTHHLESRPLPLKRSDLKSSTASNAATFFVELDQRYVSEIASAVRSVAGPDVPVSGTQIIHSGRWKHGGFANFDVNRDANYVDAHFYIDHYWFPHRQWDWSDWRISNSWIGDAFENTLLNVAFARAENKPFVVSEFNQPWPNQHASDLLPAVTQFAVGQDWDGLILYSYSHDQNWETANPSDFSLKGDSTKLAQFAQCARYFRSILPETALPRTVISLTRDDRITATLNNISGNLGAYLSKHFGVAPSTAETRQIQIGNSDKFGIQSVKSPRTSSYLFYNPQARQIIFGSSYAAGISGYLPVNQTARSPVLDLTLAQHSSGFATAFITSLDGSELQGSKRLLLSLPGFTMGKAGAGPQRLESTDLPGTWWTIRPETGNLPSANLYQVPGPAQMERVPATIVLHIPNERVTVHALGADGSPISQVPVHTDGKSLTFSVNAEGQPIATNYEIAIQP